jgi:hypothetical protein
MLALFLWCGSSAGGTVLLVIVLSLVQLQPIPQLNKIMKVLEFFNNCFGAMPRTPNLKHELELQLKELGPEKFFSLVIMYLGGRGYNEFLDYSLFFLKLRKIFEDCSDIEEKETELFLISDQLCHRLLWDDRHDLYQNLPYILEELPYNRYDKVCVALIESFNPKGTGDIIYKHSIL